MGGRPAALRCPDPEAGGGVHPGCRAASEAWWAWPSGAPPGTAFGAHETAPRSMRRDAEPSPMSSWYSQRLTVPRRH
eukprot:7768790-Pyramimonas_sp.AAC.1